jgi:hypothetical protein
MFGLLANSHPPHKRQPDRRAAPVGMRRAVDELIAVDGTLSVGNRPVAGSRAPTHRGTMYRVSIPAAHKHRHRPGRPTLSIERWGWDCGGPHGAEAPLSVEELHPTCRQSSLSLVPGPARVAGSGPLIQAEVRPCPPVKRSDRAEERRPRSPGRRAESSDRESGVRRHRILSTAQMGLPARDGSRLGRGPRLGRRHGLGWGHWLGRHRSRQLLLSLALRTHLHRYPSTVDSAIAGPRPLGADPVGLAG